MKVIYKGYEINVHREKCLAGYPLLYFTVIRESDGFFAVDSFTEGTDTVRDYVRYMRERIDAELASDRPWGEAA